MTLLARQRDMCRLADLRAGQLGGPSVCTIILEVLRPWQDEGAEICVSLSLRSTMGPSVSDLRIVYDYTQPCTPAQPALLLHLSSNMFIARLPPKCLDFTYQFGLTSHMIRVKPTGSGARRVPLPAEVIRRIAELSIVNRSTGWRQALLSYGLVCKAWSHVLDLFFLSFDDSGTGFNDNPDICLVAQSLDARPGRGSLMPAVSIRDFTSLVDADGLLSSADSHALLTVLGHASPVLLKVLRLFLVPVDIAEDMQRRLERLHALEEVALGWEDNTLGFDMDTIQALVSKWPRLLHVNFIKWAESDGTKNSLPPSLMCKLRTLDLDTGVIKGPQLMRFIASPNQCLSVFRMSEVNGLWNHDLALFLSTVASTLEDIQILNCQFLRVSDEEFAIDVVVPMFQAALFPNLGGTGLASAKAISRKRADKLEPVIQGPVSSLVLQLPVGEISEDAARQALEVTGWASVIILWSGGGSIRWVNPESMHLPGMDII
ncbi:hypothetical protein DXG01_014023 [Tephrocybe rancida]|nr:hypothetical protein DXG01_014023 [Tephrocybe rancida]